MKPAMISRKAGFTLAEILLAVLVFAIAISTILALLATSLETAEEVLVKDEAMNLTSALESYFEELPFYDGTPDCAYTIVQTGGNSGVYAFYYQGSLSATQTDESPAPINNVNGLVLGEDYTVVPTIRSAGDALLNGEKDAATGRAFFIRLQVSPANPWSEKNSPRPLPSDPDADVGGRPDYDSAVLVIQAEFLPIPRAIITSNTGSPNFVEIIGNATPAFTYNFAVRR